jgi:hypothetical protein
MRERAVQRASEKKRPNGNEAQQKRTEFSRFLDIFLNDCLCCAHCARNKNAYKSINRLQNFANKDKARNDGIANERLSSNITPALRNDTRDDSAVDDACTVTFFDVDDDICLFFLCVCVCVCVCVCTTLCTTHSDENFQCLCVQKSSNRRFTLLNALPRTLLTKSRTLVRLLCAKRLRETPPCQNDKRRLGFVCRMDARERQRAYENRLVCARTDGWVPLFFLFL